ncbi:helix-turn-helix domain-containing protein [Gayadomonas joobiniege]|uniref:helix-turn-helix domain-containing protein n=1 Tax=Gayadomonas joobiniege TaxID=1234606 RepID=UPI00035E5DB7|nr:helix-turn-helix domain-containing protein [Gayadomonas joobiniege]
MLSNKNKLSFEHLQKQQQDFIKEISLQPHFLDFVNSVDNISIFFKNRHGQIVFGNRFLLNSLGIEHHADLLKFQDEDFFPEYLAKKFKQDDSEVINTCEPKKFIVELFKNEQGILGWFVTHKYPVLDTKQNVIGVMGSIQEYKAINPGAYQTKGAIFDSSQYIQEHFRDNLSINDLADMANMPIRRYQRHFKQIFNISPQEYIIRHRLHCACELLKHSTTPISTIAVESGFYDQSSFTRQFKKYLYTTPFKYRKNLSLPI